MATRSATPSQRAAPPLAPEGQDDQIATARRRSSARRPRPRRLDSQAHGFGKTLPASFYARPVLEVARDLIGCVLAHDGSAGVIVETEAYHQSEPACHAYAGLTPRTGVLFGEPGRAYVYRSYGIHSLFNAVCEPPEVGAAVLIRALQPLAGVDLMRRRRHPTAVPNGHADTDLCSGPGKLTEALAIDLSHNGCDLAAGPITIHLPPAPWLDPPVIAGPRIGITKAPDLPWRFCLTANSHVSRPRPDGWPSRRRS